MNVWFRYEATQPVTYMQKKLIGLQSTLTGGISVSRGNSGNTISYRQLPTVPTPTDVDLTVTKRSASELRFTMENVQMPVFLDATCTPI